MMKMMKRSMVAAVAVLGIPAGVTAQVSTMPVEDVLAAAPARGRDDVSVIRWNADYTYQTVKDGSGPMVCYDRSTESRRAAFDVQCTSKANLDRVAQNRKFRAEAADRQAEGAMVAAAEADGTRAPVEFGSIWIAMRGDDKASAGTHTTIAVPGATTASTGLPENGRQGGAYIMGAGTAGAHIMTPGN